MGGKCVQSVHYKQATTRKQALLLTMMPTSAKFGSSLDVLFIINYTVHCTVSIKFITRRRGLESTWWPILETLEHSGTLLQEEEEDNSSVRRINSRGNIRALK